MYIYIYFIIMIYTWIYMCTDKCIGYTYTQETHDARKHEKRRFTAGIRAGDGGLDNQRLKDTTVIVVRKLPNQLVAEKRMSTFSLP